MEAYRNGDIVRKFGSAAWGLEDHMHMMRMMGMSLKKGLKRSSLVVNTVHAFQSIKHKWQVGSFGWVRTDNEIVRRLNTFSPNSRGSLHAQAGVALQSAQQVFPLLCSIIETNSKSLLAPRPIEDIYGPQTNSNDVIQLASLFDQYGSDKSNYHNYHLLYAGLLGPKRSSHLRILEIGLGTNNPDILSNMGPGGKPGASLRAFRDFCPNAELFGADIDHRILFKEDRIHTYYVDQTRTDSLELLHSKIFHRPFDLIIDDGLHSPNANIATMILALRILRSQGFFIVEDIPPRSIPIWQVVAALCPHAYRPTIVQAKNACLFMIQKPGLE
jgi:hypothetical protein